jgi:hypothetical protein
VKFQEISGEISEISIKNFKKSIAAQNGGGIGFLLVVPVKRGPMHGTGAMAGAALTKQPV